jgi:hypothetical protein
VATGVTMKLIFLPTIAEVALNFIKASTRLPALSTGGTFSKPACETAGKWRMDRGIARYSK